MDVISPSVTYSHIALQFGAIGTPPEWPWTDLMYCLWSLSTTEVEPKLSTTCCKANFLSSKVHPTICSPNPLDCGITAFQRIAPYSSCFAAYRKRMKIGYEIGSKCLGLAQNVHHFFSDDVLSDVVRRSMYATDRSLRELECAWASASGDTDCVRTVES